MSPLVPCGLTQSLIVVPCGLIQLTPNFSGLFWAVSGCVSGPSRAVSRPEDRP